MTFPVADSGHVARLAATLFALAFLAAPLCADEPKSNALPAGALARLGQPQANGADVWAVAFAPDGKVIASGHRDGLVRLWDVATGKERGQLRGHTGDVHAVLLTPDGKTVASASRDGTVRLWDAVTGKELYRLEGHQRGVYSLAISPDGDTLASGSVDRTIRLWNVGTGQPRRTLQGHGLDVLSLAFAPNGATLISGSRDQTVRFWGPVTGRERFLRGDPNRPQLGQPMAWVSVVSISPDGKTLAMAGRGGSIEFWELASGELFLPIHTHDDLIAAVAFSPDSKTVAWSGGFDHTLYMADLATGRRWRLSGHQATITAIGFAPDGRTIATASSDGTVLLWGLTNRPPQTPAVQLTAKELSEAWEDLGSKTGEVGFAALGRLVGSPEQAVAFLRDQLPPVPRTGHRSLDLLLADLDSDSFPVRHAANEELQKLGLVIEGPLTKALARREQAGALPLEVRLRVERVLRDLDGYPIRIHEGELRHVRAVQVLEYIGTAAARQTLQRLAGGAPLVRLTQEAQGALDRLHCITITDRK